jgi:hypothetical protein
MHFTLNGRTKCVLRGTRQAGLFQFEFSAGCAHARLIDDGQGWAKNRFQLMLDHFQSVQRVHQLAALHRECVGLSHARIGEMERYEGAYRSTHPA